MEDEGASNTLSYRSRRKPHLMEKEDRIKKLEQRLMEWQERVAELNE
jgi:hypothetical protein